MFCCDGRSGWYLPRGWADRLSGWPRSSSAGWRIWAHAAWGACRKVACCSWTSCLQAGHVQVSAELALSRSHSIRLSLSYTRARGWTRHPGRPSPRSLVHGAPTGRRSQGSTLPCSPTIGSGCCGFRLPAISCSSVKMTNVISDRRSSKPLLKVSLEIWY